MTSNDRKNTNYNIYYFKAYIEYHIADKPANFLILEWPVNATFDDEIPFSPTSSPNFKLQNPLSEELEPTAPQAEAELSEVNVIIPMMVPPRQDHAESEGAEEGAVGGQQTVDDNENLAAVGSYEYGGDEVVDDHDENVPPKMKEGTRKSNRERMQS